MRAFAVAWRCGTARLASGPSGDRAPLACSVQRTLPADHGWRRGRSRPPAACRGQSGRVLSESRPMAAIDPLLGIGQMRRAGGLLLACNEVPSLLVGETRTPLTMPPLSAGMLDDLLESVLAPPDRAALARDGSVQSTYRSDLHGTYVVRARAADGKTVLELLRGSAADSDGAGTPARAAESPVRTSDRPAQPAPSAPGA